MTERYVSRKVYDELEEMTRYDRGTVQNAKYVSEKTSSLRHENLSFKHNQQVASLEIEDQQKFLTKASEEKLLVRELRDEIKKSCRKCPDVWTKIKFTTL